MSHDQPAEQAHGEAVDDLLAAAYALDGPEANRELYARWAATYDSGFVVDSGYRYHEHVARLFHGACSAGVAPADVVVDLGCGTGLGGAALRSHRHVHVDGVDISPEMLRKAALKRHDGEPVYRRLQEADLTRPLPIADGTYAGAMSVGTFTHGHVGPEAIHEVVRIVRPGGVIALGINAAHFAAEGFAATLDQLLRSGRISGLALVDVPIYGDDRECDDEDDPDRMARVATFAVVRAG